MMSQSSEEEPFIQRVPENSGVCCERHPVCECQSSQEDRSNMQCCRWLPFFGLAFFLIFTAFNTCSLILQVVIDSIQKDDPSFTGSGYVSLAVVYAVFATTNWVAPSCLTILGPKLTMVAGALTYTLFIASFLWPHTWLLYLVSVVVGLGAALIWTGQGNYLTLMSDDVTITRNSGIFWSMLQCSMVFGNIFVFVKFRGQEVISADTRFVVFISLTAVSVAGTLVLLLLPKPGSQSGRSDATSSPAKELMKSFKLFVTKDMLLLSVTFFYTGLELSFFSGVYSACLSFTQRFPDPKMLVGLSGISIGVGEILAGATFGIFGSKTIKFGRDPIVLLGFLIHMVCFYLIFLNLPKDSPLGDTYGPSKFSDGQPIVWIALLCSFLLGFGDACFNTQVYSLLGSVYSDNSGPAFAVFKFVQSFSAACCFFYSTSISLHWHLGILVVFCVVGTLTFCVVEWNAYRKAVVKSAGPEGHDDEGEVDQRPS
ncbi:UNC93-like protein MFSD11 isoform X1 [Hyalella azteca]|uniref:UNC93-like protein MFSD11 n=2 Tax=Hyalella azteca TaxID=294128 RepID=A0A8B7NQK2_HYAAZ|nr:UNC93-like protein MFSD11 isoform X1 [Hyalella azteca]